MNHSMTSTDLVTSTDPDDAQARTAGAPTSATSVFGLPALTYLELFVLTGLAFHAILPSQPFAFPIVSHTATLFLLAPLGLVCLARATARRDRPAIAMVVFLLAATVSGLFAASPIYAIRGDVSSWMTVAATAAAAGWWMLGRSLGDGARSVLPWTLVAVMALNAVVGVLQISIERDAGLLAAIGGRAHGLLDNPVYYGSVWAGAAGWLIARGAGRSVGVWTFGVFSAGFATGLSGSRAATIAVILAAIVGIGLRRALPAVVNLVAAAAGIALASSFGRAQTSSGTLDRIASNSGIRFRLDLWRAGLDALPSRPVFGHGFNHFSSAIDGELALSFLRVTQSSDIANPTQAPHNFVILLLVSVGIVGTALFAVWLATALRGAIDRPLLIAAGTIAATWMLQPASSHSLPIAMLLLGAAIRPRSTTAEPDQSAEAAATAGATVAATSSAGVDARGRRQVLAGAVAGVVVAAYILVGMNRFDAAAGDAERLASIAAAYPSDSQVALAVSLEYEAGAARGELEPTPAVLEAIDWAEDSADVAPSAQAHTRIARLHLAIGDLPGARAALDRAFDLQFWNPSARQLQVSYAREIGDDELLAEALADACTLDLPVCIEPGDG